MSKADAILAELESLGSISKVAPKMTPKPPQIDTKGIASVCDRALEGLTAVEKMVNDLKVIFTEIKSLCEKNG